MIDTNESRINKIKITSDKDKIELTQGQTDTINITSTGQQISLKAKGFKPSLDATIKISDLKSGEYSLQVTTTDLDFGDKSILIPISIKEQVLPEATLTLSKSSTEIVKNGVETITVTAEDPNNWSFINPNPRFITIEKVGNNQLKITGKTISDEVLAISVTASKTGKKDITKTISVKVIEDTVLAILPETLQDVGIGEIVNITAITNANTITAESSDITKATVEVSGKNVAVKGIAVGTSTITVKAKNGNAPEKQVTTTAKVVSATSTKDPKYIVVAVAGQSNSVGYDESNWNPDYDNKTPDRIVQLGYYGNDNLQIIPLTQNAQNLQNMSDIQDSISPAGNYGKERKGTKGIHLPLAKEILKYIPSDYNVLVVPVAYGSTGFSSGTDLAYDEVTKKPSVNPQGGNWSLNGAYYKTLRDRVKHALDINPENKFLGVIWCQGENDTNTQVEAVKTGFQALVNQLATDWQNYKNRTVKNLVDKSIWYVYETTSYWRNSCSQVWKWYREYLGDSNYAIVAPQNNYTNEVNGAPSGQGQTSSYPSSHYGNDAFVNVVAPNVANKLVENKAIYGQLDTQTTNHTGNRKYVDKYWNPYENSIEVNDANNNINYFKAVAKSGLTSPSITFKDNIQELTLSNIIAGTIIILEHTADGKYSGLIFNDNNAGSNNTNNYTTVRGITEGKRLDDGVWDNFNYNNGINVEQKDFLNGNTKIKQTSKGVYEFYFNNTKWFEINLLTNPTSLKNNGVNESEIKYAIGAMYGWSNSQKSVKVAELSNVVEKQVTP